MPRSTCIKGWFAVASLVCGIIGCFALTYHFMPAGIGHQFVWELALFYVVLFLSLPIAFVLGISALKSKRRKTAVCGIILNAAVFFVLGAEIWTIGKDMGCARYMRGIGLSLHTYHFVHGALPPFYSVDNEGKPLHSWRVLLLPHLGDEDSDSYYPLYEKIRLDEPWNSDYNKQFHHQMPSFYQCPRNRKGCCYSAIVGGSFVPAKEAGNIAGLSFADITDGLENTLAVIEVQEPFCWMDPTADVTLDDLVHWNRVGSRHRQGVYSVFLDGARRLLDRSTPPKTLRALGTPNGGEKIDW